MLKKYVHSGNQPFKQIVNRIHERKNFPAYPKVFNKEVAIGNIYIISETSACRVLISSNITVCKTYTIKSLYSYPCNSDTIGIYSARTSITKSMNLSLLLKRVILIDK